MKAIVSFLVVSSLFLLPTLSHSADLGMVRVSLIIGDVQVKTEDTEDWVLASINMPLKENDRLWVPEEGRAELRFIDGSALRLDQNSGLDVLALDKGSYQFYLAEGHLYAHFRGIGEGVLQVDSPNASVRTYERTTFRVDVSNDGATSITVYSGSVYAETKEGATRIEPGETLSLRGESYAEIASALPSDEWERWNYERDRKYIVQARPSRYLPEEIEVYSSDLEENGRWVQVPEYGHVWTPTVVAADWAPYKVGRWVWIGGDYVWVSYEPWGWAPYHYGRWAFVASVGWCWVPPVRGAVYWGPGFVAWVHTPTYVSWVPLAPGEIYYGYGYYGPHSVNITTVNVAHIHVDKIVYRNIHVHNAVTVIHRDTFITGRHVHVDIRENPFVRERISIGRPLIRPERGAFMPVVREVPRHRLPPRHIHEIRIQEVKTYRPIVRERGASIFRPGAPIREMSVRTREGRPLERRIDVQGERRFHDRAIGEPRPLRPLEPRTTRPEERRPRDEPGYRRLPDKARERGEERRSHEERGPGRSEGPRPLERREQRFEDRKPGEGRFERPADRRPGESGAPAQDYRRMPERKVEKPFERPSSPRDAEKRAPSPGFQPRSSEPSRDRAFPKTPEHGGRIERPQETRPSDRPGLTPPERRPQERQFEGPKESRPSHALPERPSQQKPAERHLERPSQPSAPFKAPDKPVEQRQAPRIQERRPEHQGVPKSPERPIEPKAAPHRPSEPQIQRPVPPQSHPAPVHKTPERPTEHKPSPSRPVEQPQIQRPASQPSQPAPVQRPQQQPSAPSPQPHRPAGEHIQKPAPAPSQPSTPQKPAPQGSKEWDKRGK